ncbi:MAG: phosphoribosylaminoimidazolesuccinocarboxamide synthase [Planctomycetota bacterium]|nr:phosphoribosylaminoimidazolesuccinocarboxamide synthase [Planctomycetota bacterium]
MPDAVLSVSLPGLDHRESGKVREIFDLGERLIIVATDRVSAFDVVLDQGIPGRGAILTRLSEFWFGRLECPNHLITTDMEQMPEAVQAAADALAGRTMLVKKADIVPVECVVRGYLAGSGWKDYKRSQTVCGVPLPAGLVQSDKLPEPIFTPTTKAKKGHDQPMTFDEVTAELGGELASRLRRLSIGLYKAGAAYAKERGIILADTKFEFGLLDGELLLCDEALTPDSSRYWDEKTYEPGRPQDSFDKQIVRDHLETTDWNKQPPPPAVPDEIIEKAAKRYEEIADRLMQ